MMETDFHFTMIFASASALAAAIRSGDVRVEAQRRDVGRNPGEGYSAMGHKTIRAFFEREGLLDVAFLYGPWMVSIGLPRACVSSEVWEEAVRLRQLKIESLPR